MKPLAQPDLFSPRVIFRGVVAYFHSGSGETLRWSAARYDVGVSFDGRFVETLNFERSGDFERIEDLRAAFGPPRECPPRLIKFARERAA